MSPWKIALEYCECLLEFLEDAHHHILLLNVGLGNLQAQPAVWVPAGRVGSTEIGQLHLLGAGAHLAQSGIYQWVIDKAE